MVHFDGGVLYVVRFLLHHVVLLGTEHGSRSSNSSPTDKSFSGYLIVLHAVQTDKGSCASEASFAMYSDSACIRVGKMTLAGAQKLLYDVSRGSRSVDEHHVIVGNATLLKLGLVVLGLVQSDDSRHF
jgi:hypothetical protein